MNKASFGVFCIALASLLLELNLIRVFDVLWYPNMSYMIITLAVFSFGLAGVYLAVRPMESVAELWTNLATLTVLMTGWVLTMQLSIDRLPFDYNQLVGAQAGKAAANFLLIYFVVCVPFFLAGLVLSVVFSHFARQIRSLYFWDLIGAAIGSVILIPLLPIIGTTGSLYVVAALALISSLCFYGGKNRLVYFTYVVAICSIMVFPFARDHIDTFEPHMDKRGYKANVGEISEGTWWDPISKIDLLNTEAIGQNRKWIAYDGGTQSSYFYPFDGDFEALRASLPGSAAKHFWSAYVAISHYLKADTDARVLVIGSAGGQELKAALTYNASEVDAIELVGTVVALGKTRYAEYTGNIMNDPRANVQRGEGRSFLRQSNKTYDIIQMFSNHTSSSIAAGSGAMQANYLQTVEAYKEYFSHLSAQGILHINHHVYPKMVATASKAWAEMGMKDFRKHLIVAEVPGIRDDLPTMMIKMSPWTQQDIAKIKAYLGHRYQYPADPLLPESSFLTEDFFSGGLPQSVLDSAPYRIEEPTDDKPFFNSLRINLETLPTIDRDRYVNTGVSSLMNSQKSTGYPVDVMHLIVSAGAAIVFAILFTLGPLLFAKTGQQKWLGKTSFIVYFCSLGLGFIVFELVAIQIFMKVIGFPLYTYTAVLFTFLFGAGVGSLASGIFRLLERDRIWVPFVGIALASLFIIFCKLFLFDSLLEMRTMVRIISSVLIIFPLAFFLGMPFPMGVLAIEKKPQGTIAWAWGLNGLFTVAGGIFCAVFSVYYGFVATMLVAVATYMVAWAAYRNLHKEKIVDS
jgi:spermidine synthase